MSYDDTIKAMIEDQLGIKRTGKKGYQVDLARDSDTVLYIEEYGPALLGITTQSAHGYAKQIAVYDSAKVVELIMEQEQLSKKDALDVFHYEVAMIYLGDHTPMFLDTFDTLKAFEHGRTIN